ncbi:MAG: serine hydrolase [Chloroflexota bacterium]
MNSRDWQILETTVEGMESQGTIGVHIVGPEGKTWGHRQDEQFPAASTVKIGIMIEIYRKLERGELQLDQVHTLEAGEKTDGSGVMRHLHDGLELTIADLLYLMMAISDNTATNLLIDYGTMEDINATMLDVGMRSSRLNRPMLGRLAREGDPPENLATPEDYTRAIQAILITEAASPESCRAMVETLEKQQNARRIGRFVPDEEGYRWGSKTGSLSGVTNDVGFVTTPKGTMIVAIFGRDLPDQHTGEQLIADIARLGMEACDLI